MRGKHGTKANQLNQEDVAMLVQLAIGRFAGSAIAGEIEGINPSGKAVAFGIETMRGVIDEAVITRAVQLNVSQSTMDTINQKAWEMFIAKITEGGKKAQPAIMVPDQRGH